MTQYGVVIELQVFFFKNWHYDLRMKKYVLMWKSVCWLKGNFYVNNMYL